MTTQIHDGWNTLFQLSHEYVIAYILYTMFGDYTKQPSQTIVLQNITIQCKNLTPLVLCLFDSLSSIPSPPQRSAAAFH